MNDEGALAYYNCNNYHGNWWIGLVFACILEYMARARVWELLIKILPAVFGFGVGLFFYALSRIKRPIMHSLKGEFNPLNI